MDFYVLAGKRKDKSDSKSSEKQDDLEENSPEVEMNVEKWLKFGISNPVIKALQDLKFEEPTPIQVSFN